MQKKTVVQRLKINYFEDYCAHAVIAQNGMNGGGVPINCQTSKISVALGDTQASPILC